MLDEISENSFDFNSFFKFPFCFSVEVGCHENFSSDKLASFNDEIDWSSHISSQLRKIVAKCANLAVEKKYRFFAVEDFGNCQGRHVFVSRSKASRCNHGVGLKGYYYVYEVSSWTLERYQLTNCDRLDWSLIRVYQRLQTNVALEGGSL